MNDQRYRMINWMITGVEWPKVCDDQQMIRGVWWLAEWSKEYDGQQDDKRSLMASRMIRGVWWSVGWSQEFDGQQDDHRSLMTNRMIEVLWWPTAWSKECDGQQDDQRSLMTNRFTRVRHKVLQVKVKVLCCKVKSWITLDQGDQRSRLAVVQFSPFLEDVWCAISENYAIYTHRCRLVTWCLCP